MLFSDLFVRGFELLLLGMGGTLGYTLLLQVLIGQMSRFCARYEPPPPVPLSRLRAELERERVAAIAVAVHKYRTRLHQRAAHPQ